MRAVVAMFFVTGLLLGAASVTLVWDANSETNLAGYRVHYGTNSRVYPFACAPVMGTTQVVVLPYAARWYFAVTASNRAGLVSLPSNEAVWDPPPGAPHLLTDSFVLLSVQLSRSTNLVDWARSVPAELWVPATNAREFFRAEGLQIERFGKVRP